MTSIKRTLHPEVLQGNFRRALPLVVFVAATMLAGCVAYPYPGGYHEGYYHPHPDYQPHPYYAGQWNGNQGWH